jgi:CheY-like chemotaxis protein
MGQLHSFGSTVSGFRMASESDPTAIPGGRTYHILLAEDSSADIGIVRIALREQNFDYVLHLAKDGAEAIAYILDADANSNVPLLDLLLLDMHLPKHGGEEILKCLRSTERYANTPVVVMSSSDAPADHETAQKHAAVVYFRKPSSFVEFAAVGNIVREILSGSRSTTLAPQGSSNEVA